jgi:hypothetical protein
MSGFEARDPDSAERRLSKLLQSMSADAPRPGAKSATLAALGLGTATAVATGTAGALGASGLVKFGTIGAVFGFAVGGVAVGVQYALSPEPLTRSDVAVAGASSAPAASERPAPTHPSVSAPSAPVGREVSKPTVPAAPAARAAERPEEERGPLEDPTAGRAPEAVATFEVVPSSPSSLREETRELDRVRAAIVAGDPGAGLAALDRYVAAFPRGALSKEAALLRIKALLMRGDRPRARALARSFMAAHPRDPHVDELRSLLEP